MKLTSICHGFVLAAGMAALAALFGLLATGHAQGYVRCHADRLYEQTIEGFFVRSERKTRLHLFSHPSGKGCHLRHENGPNSKVVLQGDAAELVGVCRDPATGRDWALIYRAAGQYADLGFWSVDPVAGAVKLEYEEAWTVWGLEEDQVHEVLAGDLCRARERQAVLTLLMQALSVLRADPREDDGQKERFSIAVGASIELATRVIPQEAIHRWLSALASAQPTIAEFKGALYADDETFRSWTVIQVLGTRLYDAPGVVLVWDRKRNEWRALYDILSGGRHSLNFPMYSVVLKGNKLFAQLCMDCSGWGSYAYFEIDLKDAPRHPSGDPALPRHSR